MLKNLMNIRWHPACVSSHSSHQ